MKFALNTILLLLTIVIFLGCRDIERKKNNSSDKQDSLPSRQSDTLQSEIDFEKRSRPSKKQQQDRAIKKKKQKRALDTLKPIST